MTSILIGANLGFLVLNSFFVAMAYDDLTNDRGSLPGVRLAVSAVGALSALVALVLLFHSLLV